VDGQTGIRTDVRTGEQTFYTHVIGRLGGVNLKIYNNTSDSVINGDGVTFRTGSGSPTTRGRRRQRRKIFNQQQLHKQLELRQITTS